MKFIFLGIVLFFFVGCQQNPQCTDPCPKDMMCTMDFRTLQLSIRDSVGRPVMLDKYRTLKLYNNEEIDMQSGLTLWEDSSYKANGEYPILNDGHTNKTDRCGKEFRFLGYRQNQLVVESQYKISHDCCHIRLDSGEINLLR